MWATTNFFFIEDISLKYSVSTPTTITILWVTYLVQLFTKYIEITQLA